jgi:glycosyltransferase involved in cell wall biosynthesis
MSQKIQVALVITELEVGGAERCLVQVACGLDRERFAPVVYSLAARPPDSRSSLVRQLEDAGIPVRFVGVRAAWQLGTAVKRLRSMLAEQQPHVVQTFLFHANVVGTLAMRGLPAPRLVHGMRVADPSWFRQAVERRSTARADKVVCVSRSVSEFCATRLCVPAEKLVVIPNGIDAEAYVGLPPADLRQFGLPPGRRAIVFVGRLHPQKGLDWFLSFAPQMFEQLPDHDLLMVGNGPERGRLEAIVRSKGLGGRVHWAGWSPHVAEILLASDLLVLPSRWEGMPNVLLEGMAAGLPLVSTRAHGVEELLGPLADRQCADFGDVEAFLSRLRQLAADRQAAAELGRKNRERVERFFSRQAMLQAYEQVYASLVTP